mmetsp:Transcript_38765/g.54039  ORF Transcript_38765/g.54039 Transcript_38765/m.54039 type:complete len:345 (+) Transcript_38765:110-1144(+)
MRQFTSLVAVFFLLALFPSSSFSLSLPGKSNGVYPNLYTQAETNPTSEHLQLQLKNDCSVQDLSETLSPYYALPLMAYLSSSDTIFSLSLFNNGSRRTAPYPTHLVGATPAGEFVSQQDLSAFLAPFIVGDIAAGIAADPTTDSLLIAGPSIARNKYHLFRYFPNNETYIDYGPIFGDNVYDNDNILLVVTFAPNTNILYVSYAQDIYVFNMSAGGACISQNRNRFQFSTLDYNPSDGLLYGIGSSNECTNQLVLATVTQTFTNGEWDPTSNNIGCLGKDWNCAQFGVSSLVAIDSDQNTHYWANVCSFDIFGLTWGQAKISLKTGEVVEECSPPKAEGFVSAP